ncbi:3-methyl-2-oxobutanoate dehydrogenase subunit VorB [Caldanaerobacter subterraneus]|uniref:2-ketoisovalerate ferredoxin reductase n=3 Tax=Caldanaerobacter subterraneus TaxID=911092 RepID=U5CGF8_CALSX|nr:3-methyl-2-oxobutanoate dehydrogenase subunit VorB [Caldanaerobacter subterraneus]ERM92010.1 2-ketoisovalerate ferredoxin reductase [Caldanaerobacter subterraneus subsp. yonseiensis KB-1]NNG67252.1 3-methyl-2-oxobutanoate dehydrogenase subunit VorB [Caldanaerobacter subterraneus]
MAKVLMKGNEAMAEAAIQAGCRYYFGYPITPQNEVTEYMSKRMPEVGGVFLQAESEVSAINMVYGAGGAGARVMTSTSGPGLSLMQEGISYLAGAQIPCVIVNIMRGGPGLGNIQGAQSDYFQSVKGGGHGDYKLIVLAPSTIQEMADLVQEAFDIADEYRNPVVILGDGMLGQMMEPVDFDNVKKTRRNLPEKTWATTGRGNREHRNVINSLYIDPPVLEKHNYVLFEKYKRAEQNEVRYEMVNCDDAEVILVAYGTMARVAKNVMNIARREGYKVGLIRPISLWPFPKEPFKKTVDQVKGYLVVEMSMGQMVEDVQLATECKKPVHFYGRPAGMIPEPSVMLEKIKQIAGGAR